MKERPILFSGPMVRAILEGRKTQTRRVVKCPGLTTECEFDPFGGSGTLEDFDAVFYTPERSGNRFAVNCPYGQVGDRLWVKETFTLTQFGKAVYRADAKDQTGQRWSSIAPGDPGREVKWKPSIFMPRTASRITLEIVSVCIERLQDISVEDAFAEGVCALPIERALSISNQYATDNADAAIEKYQTVWESINGTKGAKSWNANPWVWVVEFKVVAT